MTADFNLDAYLHRIGYSGPRAATLDTLAALHLQHPAAIPFENVDPLLRRPVRLDIASLQQKLVHERRGGYCFEQNLLFLAALRSLGFTVRGLAARVLYNAPGDAIRPRSHMLLALRVSGMDYIADVGFGGLTLTAPLRLEPDVEQRTPHETFRFVRWEGHFLEQARVRGDWKTLYRFDEQEQLLPDYEVANWYTSTHPDSPFLTSLIAARAAGRTRFALLNNQFAVHHLDAQTERRTLATGPEIRRTLEETFGISLPDDPGIEQALDRVART
jgi:N-hydroxyarylamine O-acetyltransferase